MTNNFNDIVLKLGGLQVSFISLPNNIEVPNYWSSEAHIHLSWELIYMSNDSVKFVIDNKAHIIEKNEFCLIPPFTNHYMIKASSPVKMISLHFNFENDLKNNEFKFIHNSFEEVHQAVIFNGGELYEKYLHLIISLLKTKNTWNWYKAEALLTLFFMEFSEMVIIDKTFYKKINIKDSQQTANEIPRNTRIHKIERFIHENYMNNIKLSDMADCLHLSEKQTARILLGLTRMSFSELLRKKRMEHAKELILYSELPLSEIAIKTGFDSYNGFYSAFKKTYQCTPQTLRDNVHT